MDAALPGPPSSDPSFALNTLRASPNPDSDAAFYTHLQIVPAEELRSLSVLCRSRTHVSYAESLAILCARLALSARLPRGGDGGGLLEEWCGMVSGVEEGYVRMMGLRWVATAREAGRVGVRGGRDVALVIVGAMRRAVEVMGGDGAVPLTADYIAVCIAAGVYWEAMMFVPKSVRTVYEAERTCVSAADVVCEYYYVAVVEIVRGRWKKALQACRLALAVPASGLSDVAVAVYRKYLLVGLLETGTLLPPPAVSSYGASRLRSYAAEYVELGKAFAAGNLVEVRKVAVVHAVPFEQHENSELVKLLVTSMPKRRIVGLTSSFVTLALGEVASRVELESVAEAEMLILDMVAKGTIRAKIDGRTQVVRFLGNEEEDTPLEASVSAAAKAARLVLGDVASGAWANGQSPDGDIGKDSLGSNERDTMEKRMEGVLACVETIHGFKHLLLTDQAFVSLMDYSEREAKMHTGGDGVIAIGTEDADHDLS